MTPADEHDDDRPVGRVLSRREVLSLLAGTSAALVVGGGAARAAAAGVPAAGFAPAAAAPHIPLSLPSCIVRPALTEGPYFVDERLNRSDIRPDFDGTPRPGVRVGLTYLVSLIGPGSCVPLPDAMVDVWHCDGLGAYSDVGPWVGHNFLRGYQLTDASGQASFITIYPGWYPGRAVHIHFKIRVGNYSFVSQLFFDDTLTDQVFLEAPYNTRGPRDTRNPQDSIYVNGGFQMLLSLVPDGQGGYTTVFEIGLQGVTVTPVPTATVLATSTAVATAPPAPTDTAVPTSPPAATSTAAPTTPPAATATAPPCEITFSDVHAGDYFYPGVTYLSCEGAISGYADGTFRPYANITRGQLMKILALSQGWTLVNPATPTFSDVPRSNPFYIYIETAVRQAVISGYSDGTFRPGAEVTRGQICKVVVLAHGWALLNPPTPRFSDVDAGNPFYAYVETAAARGIVGGYTDGTFRPGNAATRGQLAKIVYEALHS
ncbi:MAG TPA: S-layer homology domain-containing protein [Chloroflexia bacterium]|nr:S-layer homology domain-containing protein [Chloroflexia bacterium]